MDDLRARVADMAELMQPTADPLSAVDYGN
jgi:hypothetical protein